jgi:hypothetical protein
MWRPARSGDNRGGTRLFLLVAFAICMFLL